MTAAELMKDIYGMAPKTVDTCDTLKFGNPEKNVKKAAVTCIATVDVIKAAAEWGADMIITHEPTFFEHMDNADINDEVTQKKMMMLRETGITIYRFHDGMHAADFDMIAEGELYHMGLDGTFKNGENFACNRFTLNEPITAQDLSELISNRLGINHIRICGERKKKAKNLSLCFGAPGDGIFKELKRKESEIVIAGEVCEWQWGEYARDAATLGFNKTLMILGHMGSERNGMQLLQKRLSEKYPQLEFKYFDCGEVY